MRRPTAPALAVLAIALALGACGEKDDGKGAKPKREAVTLLLDYFPNADHAGLYAAQAAGHFDKAGIDLTIRAPSDASTPIKLVAAGKVDLAISYEPEVLLARDKGLQVVAVGALVQQPLTSLISLPHARISSAADLRGKTVGTAGIPYQSAYLKTILRRAGVPESSVKEVNVGFNLSPALLSKKVDAVLGAFWNYEGTELALKKKKPAIIRMERVGVPTYDELVLVARESDLRTRGRMVRRVMAALAQGHRLLRRDPSTGVDALLKAAPDLDRKLQEAVVGKTMAAFFPEDDARPYGWQEPREWEAYGAWMLENKLIDKPAQPTALTNEFLPGQGI